MINSMAYKGYTASIVFDTEGKIIVGRIVDIDEVISFHGESVAEFEPNFHVAIEDCLAASKGLGSAPEKPAKAKVMLRISPEIHAAAIEEGARREEHRPRRRHDQPGLPRVQDPEPLL